MDDRAKFAALWAEHQRQVFATAMYALRNRDAVEEVVQLVAIRVWRGLPSFREDCPPVAWIMTITRREIARYIGRLAVERRNEPIDEAGPIQAPEAEEESDRPPARSLVRDARAEGVISSDEEAALLARMDRPDVTWEDIGALLGADPSTCASNHCRGISKVRVYMLARRQEFLGGRTAVEKAFQASRSASGSKPTLTDEEAAAFEVFVLGAKPLRQALRKPALRSACAKVVLQLMV
jgi:RNA polymerase sigma factor (sigma-70 family)